MHSYAHVRIPTTPLTRTLTKTQTLGLGLILTLTRAGRRGRRPRRRRRLKPRLSGYAAVSRRLREPGQAAGAVGSSHASAVSSGSSGFAPRRGAKLLIHRPKPRTRRRTPTPASPCATRASRPSRLAATVRTVVSMGCSRAPKYPPPRQPVCQPCDATSTQPVAHRRPPCIYDW